MREKSIVTAIQRWLKASGWLAVKLHGGPLQCAGLPDLLVLVDGQAVWLEVKRPGQKPTRLQSHMTAKLRAAGCQVATVTSLTEAQRFIEEVRS